MENFRTDSNYRVTKRDLHRHCTDSFEQGDWTMRWSSVGKRTSHGELPVFVARYCSNGEQSVGDTHMALDLDLNSFPATEKMEEDAMDADDDLDYCIGNPNRRLWKATCTRAALNVSPPSLCPSIHSYQFSSSHHFPTTSACFTQRLPRHHKRQLF